MTLDKDPGSLNPDNPIIQKDLSKNTPETLSCLLLGAFLIPSSGSDFDYRRTYGRIHDWDKLEFLEKKYSQVKALLEKDLKNFEEFLNSLKGL